MNDLLKNPINIGNLNRLPVLTLAEKQQSMGKLNNCVFHTIASILNIHFGWEKDGAVLAKEFDDSWWKTPFFYRTWPNFATTPCQAQRVLRKKAIEYNFTVQFKLGKFSDEYLKNILRYSPNRYPIVTFIWLKHPLNLITHKGKHPYPMHSLPGPGAHTMLLAAYKPENKTADGINHPWGFVNSWARDGITDLFWMSDETWPNTKKLRTLMVILN